MGLYNRMSSRKLSVHGASRRLFQYCWICLAGVLGLYLIGADGIRVPSAYGAEQPQSSSGEVLNLVYIIADDQAYGDFGFLGSPDALTPHLDRLAAESARFPHGYVPSSLCSPSLAALLTGKYPHQSGLHYNHPPPGNSAFNRMTSRQEYEQVRSRAFSLIRQQPTLPRMLARRGYACLQTGKFWEGHYRNAGFTHGMTIFEPRPGQDYGGNRVLASGELAAHGNGDHGLAIGRETMQPIADFLDEFAHKQPFFIWYAPFLPHQPHDSPEHYHELHRQRGAAEHRIPYLASISQFDDTVGELLEMLATRGLTESTLVVFLSDNGWVPGEVREKRRPEEFAPIAESKYSPFEGGLRTPILLSLPGKIPPATHPQPVNSIDLLPTVLAALNEAQAAAQFPGRSLWKAARGQEKLALEPVFGAIYPGDASQLGAPSQDIAYRWVRYGEWKLIVPHSQQNQAPWKNFLTSPALFHLASDPDETRNLASDPQHQPRRQQLQQLLDDWWTPGDDSAVPQPR